MLTHKHEETKEHPEDAFGREEESVINLVMTEDGIKRQAGIDYTSKFKELNWTSDIRKELPIRVVIDRERKTSNSAERLPGSETPITISQAFLSKVT